MLLFVRNQVLKPFEQLSEVPYALAKGNPAVPLQEERNRFFGKFVRQRGWFYIVAGRKAASIDGPCPNTIPPYNQCVVLGPDDPEKVSRDIAGRLGFPVLIVDLNDLGGNILAASDSALDRGQMLRILQDNPLGQSGEQTPMGIIRRAMA